MQRILRISVCGDYNYKNNPPDYRSPCEEDPCKAVRFMLQWFRSKQYSAAQKRGRSDQ